jgi:tetratricopeptide (TPR) repeat protein
MEHGKTMDTTFKLLNCLIGQYKLNETEELVDEIMPICVKHKEQESKWYIKAIQSSGFCKYKQYKFKEALALFLEQESIIGPSAALCENIGHTQSSLGMLQEAEASFEKGIELLKMGSFGNKGGIYLGLGLVRERLGRNKEALEVLLQALEVFKKQHSDGSQEFESSTVAKAHTSVGNLYKKLGDLAKAGDHFRSSLQIFRRTVGAGSPLTASALANLGKLLLERKEYTEAQKCLKESLALEVRKDAFHLDTIWEVLDKIKTLHTEVLSSSSSSSGGLAGLAQAFEQYLPLIMEGQARLCNLPPNIRKPDEGTVAVWNKTSGEMCVMAGHLKDGKDFLGRAVKLLTRQKEAHAGGEVNVQSLIDECKALLVYIQNQNQAGEAGGIGVEELDISSAQ